MAVGDDAGEDQRMKRRRGNAAGTERSQGVQPQEEADCEEMDKERK